MTHPPLILASASPRRVALLAQIGITPADIIPAEIDETPQQNELPRHYATRMAEEKCRAVAAHIGSTDAVILAADTVVACGRRILPKADEEATAERCLRLLSGRRHQVTSAVTVQQPDGQRRTRLSQTMVQMKRLSEEELRAYLACGEWHGKAGGYAIQGRAAAFITRINGSYSGVVGLPLEVVGKML